MRHPVIPSRRPGLRLAPPLVAALAAIWLGGCGILGAEGVTPSTVAIDARGDAVGPFDNENNEVEQDSLLRGLFESEDDEDEAPSLPVNRHLWRAALDTLTFLPLASTDPFGGVIVTDWGSPADNPNERFKVAAFITSAVLKADSLRVVVNRQTRADEDGWTPAAVAPETALRIENAILTRARQLKFSETAG